ncbi:MAG: ankyrin repeat domain-containing protein [Parachlamydiaceae bacterium]
MTLSISPQKREASSSSPEPKRQKVIISRTDQRIHEILNHRSLIKHYRDLLVRWHEIAGKEIPKQLKCTSQSPKWAVSIDPSDNFIHLAMKMRDYPLTKAVITEHPQVEHPLSLAISLGDQKIQGLFAKRGLQDAEGNTILHVLFGNRVAEGQTPPDFAPFEEANPDLTTENTAGKTCYELAVDNFHRKSFRRMMAYMESKGQPISPALSKRALSYKEPQDPDGWIRCIMEVGCFQVLGRFAQASRNTGKIAREVLIQKVSMMSSKVKTYETSLLYMQSLKNELSIRLGRSSVDVHSLAQDEICFTLANLGGTYIDDKRKARENPLLDLLALKSSWKGLGKLPVQLAGAGAIAVCYAVLYNKFELLKRLLEHGYPVESCDYAEVDENDDELNIREVNRSPLHLAAEYNRYEMIPLLIRAGAKLTERSLSCGRTPMRIALENDSTESMQILSDALLKHADEILAAHQ